MALEDEVRKKRFKYWQLIGMMGHLGNAEDETRQLLKWMQENPLAVADYLDAVWVPEHSKRTTDPFRKLTEQNKLWQFDL